MIRSLTGLITDVALTTVLATSLATSLVACSSSGHSTASPQPSGTIVAPAPSVTAPRVIGSGSSSVNPTSSNIELEVHALVNGHRADQGLPMLSFDDAIAELSRRHSRDMAAGRVPFSHDGFDARGNEIAGFLRHSMIAENVQLNQVSASAAAREAVEQWLTSAPHRRNIEGPFDVAGVGHARAGDGTHYFTQIFIRRGS